MKGELIKARVSEQLKSAIAARAKQRGEAEAVIIREALATYIQRDAEQIQVQPDCRRYRESRRDPKRPDRGGRAVDLELHTLSNVLRHAVSHGHLLTNPLATGRPKFAAKTIRHCRDTAPLHAEELHALAAHLFAQRRSEILGWQLLIEAMTGCRTSEVLRLRTDAQRPRDPGYVEGEWLWLHRAKNGVNPFALVHPALRACLDALHRWRLLRKISAPWYFPSPTRPGSPVAITSLTQALRTAGPLVVGRHLTSHGLRSYYVTVRRSQSISDAQIAAEIGDKSGAAIIVSTYGSIPPNWRGEKEITWLPAPPTPPAWECFAIPDNSIPLPTAQEHA